MGMAQVGIRFAVLSTLALHIVAQASNGKQFRGSQDFCDNSYQCPAHSKRKPNRNCYNNFDDCECDFGYKKDGSRCVPEEPCVQIHCSSGTQLVGMDGNGCGGTCEPCAQIQCSFGTELIGDTNGCGGKCELCAVPFCSPGTQVVGVDGNGCGGTCEPCA